MNHSEALFKLADTLDGTSTRVQKWGPCQNVLREITTNLKNIAASIDESDSDGEDAAVTEFIWLGAPERDVPIFDATKFAEEEKKFREAAKVYLDNPTKETEKKMKDVLRKLSPELSVFFADKSQSEAVEYGINREKWAELATYSMLHGLRYRFPQGFDDFLSNNRDYAVYRNDPLSMPYEMLQKCVVEFLRELEVFSDDHTPIWGAKKFSANASPDQVANTERMLAQRMMTADNIDRLNTERNRREQLNDDTREAYMQAHCLNLQAHEEAFELLDDVRNFSQKQSPDGSFDEFKNKFFAAISIPDFDIGEQHYPQFDLNDWMNTGNNRRRNRKLGQWAHRLVALLNPRRVDGCDIEWTPGQCYGCNRCIFDYPNGGWHGCHESGLNKEGDPSVLANIKGASCLVDEYIKNGVVSQCIFCHDRGDGTRQFDLLPEKFIQLDGNYDGNEEGTTVPDLLLNNKFFSLRFSSFLMDVQVGGWNRDSKSAGNFDSYRVSFFEHFRLFADDFMRCSAKEWDERRLASGYRYHVLCSIRYLMQFTCGRCIGGQCNDTDGDLMAKTVMERGAIDGDHTVPQCTTESISPSQCQSVPKLFDVLFIAPFRCRFCHLTRTGIQRRNNSW